MARRGHGEGSLRRRPDGRWEARVRSFTNGRHRRVSVYGETQHEVLAKLRALHLAREKGLAEHGQQQPLRAFLETWLSQRDPQTPVAGVRKLRYSTWTGYESRMRRHVIPVLGSIPIGRLTPEHVRALLAKLAADGLSPTTVAMVRDTLATAMRRAVRDRLLPFNPVEAVDSVPRSRPRTFALTASKARALLEAAKGDPFEALYVLALRAGLRQSELLGLKWEDVDLDAATLRVRRALIRVKGAGLREFEPKTVASAATVPLAPAAVIALRARRTQQLERRLRAGPLWEKTGYVFTTELGTPISASNLLRRSFYPLCARAGIPTRRGRDGTYGLRFHDLRHACGSLLIEQGVKPKLVQAILRHSKLATTMDLYVHAYDEDLREAVGSLDGALRG